MPNEWFIQAASDLRVAQALRNAPTPMKASAEIAPNLRVDDVGCHVAAMCTQVVEKSLKGCFLLVGRPAARNHRPDEELYALLVYPSRYQKDLRKLFDLPTKERVAELLELTPGGRTSENVCNTEYPWFDDKGRYAPATAQEFQNREILDRWIKLARRIHWELDKIRIADERAPARSRKKRGS